MVYWGDCILIIVHLRNKTAFPLLSNKTTFELLWKKKLAYSHLCNFGCLCYASTLDRHRTNFSPHVIPFVFLRYPSGYKEYKLLNLVTNSVFISHNVVFHESIFSFKTIQTYSPLPNIFSDTVLLFPSFSSILESTSLPISTIPTVFIPSTSHCHPNRVRRPPFYLAYYYCYSCSHSTSSTSHPLTHVLDYTKLSNS